jgi:hypothetical protein
MEKVGLDAKYVETRFEINWDYFYKAATKQISWHYYVITSESTWLVGIISQMSAKLWGKICPAHGRVQNRSGVRPNPT